MNRVTKVTFPGGKTNTFVYTSMGSPWKSTDELNRVTTTEYDEAGRAKKVFSPMLADGTQAVTETVYLGDRVQATINPLGQRTD